jgi:hypothetical protein
MASLPSRRRITLDTFEQLEVLRNSESDRLKRESAAHRRSLDKQRDRALALACLVVNLTALAVPVAWMVG